MIDSEQAAAGTSELIVEKIKLHRVQGTPIMDITTLAAWGLPSGMLHASDMPAADLR